MFVGIELGVIEGVLGRTRPQMAPRYSLEPRSEVGMAFKVFTVRREQIAAFDVAGGVEWIEHLGSALSRGGDGAERGRVSRKPCTRRSQPGKVFSGT